MFSRTADRDFEQEMETHLQLMIDDNLRAGVVTAIVPTLRCDGAAVACRVILRHAGHWDG